MNVTSICRIGLLAAVSTATSTALAQSFNLERLPNVAQASDGFATSRLLGMGAKRWGLSLTVDYAKDPLVVELVRPPDTELALVGDYFAAHLAGTYGFSDSVTAIVGLDAPAVIEGDDVPSRQAAVPFAAGGGVGDLWLGGKAVLFGRSRDLFTLGAQVLVSLPLSSAAGDQRFRGEKTLTLWPNLIGEMQLGAVHVDANLGFLLRGQTPIGDTTLGNDFRYSVSVGVPLHTQVEVLAEGFGVFPLTDFADANGVIFEWLAGPKFHTESGLATGAAFGMGTTGGIGSPDFRVIASVAHQSATPRAAGTSGQAKATVKRPPDMCPNEPEDVDGFLDYDGCPDPDDDQDGIVDVEDKCPNESEDMDGVEDTDGCPEAATSVPDQDKDGLLDAQDRCAAEAEDVDQFDDTDGCPDPDNDGDTVLDANDKCPLEPGAVTANGCPQAIRVSGSTIQLAQQIQFTNGRDTILAASFPLLEELASVLKAMQSIRKVRIEGHTDNTGDRWMNMRLSKRRASSLKRWLVEHGIEAARLDAWGCGESAPLQPNDTPEGLAANRRVGLLILEPSSGDASLLQTCEASE